MPLLRHPANPILTRREIPALAPHLADVSSVFNPGAFLLDGRTVLLLRVQSRGRETFLVTAESADGVKFEVHDRPIEVRGLERIGAPVYHLYDPRVTRLEGSRRVVLSADTDLGCRVVLGRLLDLDTLEIDGVASAEDSRNGVLFPERIDGAFALLERPNAAGGPGDPPSGESIVLSVSTDLHTWRRRGVVFSGRPHHWDERIGAGPPPVKTREGWLLLYHGVATHFASASIYQAGVALLDLGNPTRVLARSRANILEPRELYECVGQVPNVVFPSGWTIDPLDDEGYATRESRVCVYYGAADTVVGLATGTIGGLLDACRKG
jgi:beta-1,4-mannooligosaccharide/beta-1,4-mannosyl-N-acetylglucosamine phosphorylase